LEGANERADDVGTVEMVENRVYAWESRTLYLVMMSGLERENETNVNDGTGNRNKAHAPGNHLITVVIDSLV